MKKSRRRLRPPKHDDEWKPDVRSSRRKVARAGSPVVLPFSPNHCDLLKLLAVASKSHCNNWSKEVSTQCTNQFCYFRRHEQQHKTRKVTREKSNLRFKTKKVSSSFVIA